MTGIPGLGERTEVRQNSEPLMERMRWRERLAGDLLSPRFLVLGFVLLWSCAMPIEASIHEYSKQPFAPRSNAFFFHGGSEGLYSSEARADSDSNEGKSFIKFESVTFRRPKESAMKHHTMQSRSGLVEAIIVEIRDRDKIGGSHYDSDNICCTPELHSKINCNVGEVIIRHNEENSNWPQRRQIFFDGTNEEASMATQSFLINSTGMYYLYFMFCDPQLEGTTISGRTVWRNPNGYLPGKMQPLMTFFGLMSLAYLVLGLAWFMRFVQFWRDLLQLHYYITSVIGLGMCEMAFWYFEYANFNASGIRPLGITVWAVTLTAVKKTISRLLLLVVSMGYGVLRPTLGGLTKKVILLGAVYFAASEALELVEHLGNINDFSGKARLFLVLPVAVLDACFIIWIFSSLSQTLEKLQIRKNLAKMELYRRYTNTLAITALISVSWIGYELYFNATDPLSELWQRAWIIPAFWNVLSYFLLVVICILWRPSRNPTRNAYSEEAGDEFDEEAVSITNSSVKMLGDGVNKLERKERKTLSSSDHPFGIGDDLEEDKRE